MNAETNGSNKQESMSLDVGKLGMGLSRWLRYSYGGFITALLLIYLGKTKFISDVVINLKWPLALVCMIVVGATVYIFHRRIFIPLHHLWGIQVHSWYDQRKHIHPAESLNPVLWFNFLGIDKWIVGITAYSYIRSTDILKKRDELNVEHAELGLLVMTGTAFIIAGAYGMATTSSWKYLVMIAIGLTLWFVLSIPPTLVLHASECRQLRAKEKEVITELKRLGFIPKELEEAGKQDEMKED